MGPSKEFCGGTHAFNTSDLGSFKITSEESVGSGIRRIECVTKMKAYEAFKASEAKLDGIKDSLKLKNVDMIGDRITSMKDSISSLENEKAQLLTRVMNLDSDVVVSKASDNGKFKYVVLSYEGLQYNAKDFANAIKNKLNGGAVFIGNKTSEKYSFVCALGENAINAGLDAGAIVRQAATLCDGKGGGKKDLAQSGGVNNGQMTKVLDAIKDLFK